MLSMPIRNELVPITPRLYGMKIIVIQEKEISHQENFNMSKLPNYLHARVIFYAPRHECPREGTPGLGAGVEDVLHSDK
jgi:hypothetical protein